MLSSKTYLTAIASSDGQIVCIGKVNSVVSESVVLRLVAVVEWEEHKIPVIAPGKPYIIMNP